MAIALKLRKSFFNPLAILNLFTLVIYYYFVFYYNKVYTFLKIGKNKHIVRTTLRFLKTQSLIYEFQKMFFYIYIYIIYNIYYS